MKFLFPFNDKVLPNGGTVTILGSTGSIGRNCLEVLDLLSNNNKRPFKIKALCAKNDYKTLAEQAIKYNPEYIAIENEVFFNDLKSELFGFKGNILCGTDGVLSLAEQKADYVMSAIVGTAGLLPTMAAAKKDTIIALANKECLVTGGHIFLKHIEQSSAKIFPIDSEHNALFHLLKSIDLDDVDKYYLTASGGAFRDLPLDKFDNITPKMAKEHPNWSMGAKISVDSATMMNKGLELIEAIYLFNLPADKCDAVLHKQSIVHGMISNQQGEIKMLASEPDMKIPIFSSLTYGNNIDMQRELIPSNIADLSFSEIDKDRYPLFFLAKETISKGSIYPIIFNAAGEVAVELFLEEKIPFTQISCFVEHIMNSLEKEDISDNIDNIEKVLELDNYVREYSFAAN